MITKEIKDRVFNALESYKTDMNNFLEDNETTRNSELFKKFDIRHKMVSGVLKLKIDDILNDLRASVRCGYVDKDEAELYIATCQEVVLDTEQEYINYIKNRIGEKEYFIQWVMKRNGWTRRQAEEAYE